MEKETITHNAYRDHTRIDWVPRALTIPKTGNEREFTVGRKSPQSVSGSAAAGTDPAPTMLIPDKASFRYARSQLSGRSPSIKSW